MKHAIKNECYNPQDDGDSIGTRGRVFPKGKEMNIGNNVAVENNQETSNISSNTRVEPS